MKPLLTLFLTLTSATAADLTLLDAGKTDYQIVLPDAVPTPAIDASLQQTARLLQTAFLANKAEIAIVREKERDGSKPVLMLGNTVLARKNGVEVTKLRDWSYVQRVIGKDVILVGHDHASKAKAENVRRPNWDRVGTAKAAVDFAREFLGVRFLYTDLPGYTPVSGAAKIDLMSTPAIEFLPMKTITVPDTLNVTKTPQLRVNSAHPAGGAGGVVCGAPGILCADQRLAYEAGGQRAVLLSKNQRLDSDNWTCCRFRAHSP